MNYKKLISIITVSSIVCALFAVGGCAAKKMTPSAMATYSPVKATSVSETSVSEVEPEVEAAQVEEVKPSVTPTPRMSEEERIAMARKAAEIAKQDKKDKPADTENKEVDGEAPPADGQPTEAPSQQVATPQPVQQSTPAQTQGTQSKPAQQSAPPSSAPAESGHVHSWVEQTTTVHHDEVGHYETVVVKEAWDEPVYEEVPVYESKCYSKCSKCGLSFKNLSSEEAFFHVLDCNSSYMDYWEDVQVGTEKHQTGSVHHDAVTEQRWVVDKAAYDETVVTGYACSCGATK